MVEMALATTAEIFGKTVSSNPDPLTVGVTIIGMIGGLNFGRTVGRQCKNIEKELVMFGAVPVVTIGLLYMFENAFGTSYGPEVQHVIAGLMVGLGLGAGTGFTVDLIEKGFKEMKRKK